MLIEDTKLDPGDKPEQPKAIQDLSKDMSLNSVSKKVSQPSTGVNTSELKEKAVNGNVEYLSLWI